MPKADGSEGSIFLGDVQVSKFAFRNPLKLTVADTTGRTWTVEEGYIDADERNYGLFDGDELIARLKIISSAIADPDCPTPFWSIGRIEVIDLYQGRGIASGLEEAGVTALGSPLASDLDQTLGGAGVWRRLIREAPGAIELHDANGLIGAVEYKHGSFVPDPWQFRETRLVRRP